MESSVNVGAASALHFVLYDKVSMFKRFATAALAALLPVSAIAQVIAPAIPASSPLVDQLLSPGYVRAGGSVVSTYPAIPVWASPDGRLLALVSLSQDEGAPILPRAPLMGSGADWRVIDATNLISGGMRWRMAGGFSTDVSLAQMHAVSQCTSDGSPCYGVAGAAGPQLTAGLGLNWAAADQSALYSYGMSWLRGDPGRMPLLFNPATASWSPDITSAAAPYRIDSAATLFARGQFVIDSRTRIDLGASHGTAQLLPFTLQSAPAGALSLEQSSLSFGLSQGTLRGVVIGRVIDSVGSMLPGRRWTLLDIGLSWRTPWQGELSLGTQSYLAPQAESPKRDNDIAPSRVPYVQYRQDL